MNVFFSVSGRLQIFFLDLDGIGMLAGERMRRVESISGIGRRLRWRRDSRKVSHQIQILLLVGRPELTVIIAVRTITDGKVGTLGKINLKIESAAWAVLVCISILVG